MTTASDAAPRYDAGTLLQFAQALLERAGVSSAIARDVATVLLDGDLLGHTTHGLALLELYLDELDANRMAKSGTHEVLSRSRAAELWDGHRLPGPWLTLRALERAIQMACDAGTGTVVIRHSHHIACLAAYLKQATDQGFVAVIECSDPSVTAVVPHGGLKPLITPNPIAAGLPTSTDPILIDVSTSITSMGFAKQEMTAGRKMRGAWLIDHQGNATHDPGVLFKQPKGALLPLGGLDAGHKGFALGLLIEAMTAGLAGHGRADPPSGWGGTVFVQVLNPAAFGGRDAFLKQMDFLVAAVRGAPARTVDDRVRLPGERGLIRYREQLAHGVSLYPTILPSLDNWAAKYGVPLPVAI